MRWMLVFGLLAVPAVAAAADNLLGFDAAGSRAELAMEQQFDARLDPLELKAWLKVLSAAPNHVGSPHDHRNAEKVRDMLASWGWNARIETFQVRYPTPIEEHLELVAPTRCWAVQWRRRPGADHCPSPITWGRARPRCI